MHAVWMLAEHEIRQRWRSTIALALVLGAVGAIVLATVAGARRSDSALERFNAYSRSSDVEIAVGVPTADELRAFRRQPEVAAIAVAHAYALYTAYSPNPAIAAPADTALGNDVDRARIVAGRRADPSAPNEITVGEGVATQQHLHLGGHLDVYSFTPDQVRIGARGGDPGPVAGPRVRLLVVGIERRPLDLGVRAASGGIIVLTPAFNRKYGEHIGLVTDALRVRTRAGAADVPRVIDEARQIWGREPLFDVQSLSIETEGAHNGIGVLTLALWIFAGVTALTGVVAIAAMLTRDMSHVVLDQSALRALGVTRGQRIAASGSRAALVAAVGALLAAIGALGASPLFPLGLARRADPNPGLHADWFVVTIGLPVLAVTVLTIGLFGAWRATTFASPHRAARARRHTSQTTELAGRAGFRPPATTGLRMALQAGRGSSSVPVRSATGGAAFAVAGITAVLVFAASLAHLVATPRLSGSTWDLYAEVESHPDARCVDSDDHGLISKPGITDIAAVCVRNIQIEGRPVSAWAFESLEGTVTPEVVVGRAPRGPTEVALGAVTLHAVGKRIGDTVRARGPNGTRAYRIVGRIVLPTMTDPQPLADGASFTVPGLTPIIDRGEKTTHFLLARFGADADRAALERRVETDETFYNAGGAKTPIEIGRLQQINWFPGVLDAVLAILALVAVGHTIVTSVGRRRREFALLKTLGFARRQVGAAVAWQATTLATLGLVVGIPVGLVVGRTAWRLVAGDLGVSTDATLPWPGLILTVFVALTLVNLIAFFPARAAARTRPADGLRSE